MEVNKAPIRQSSVHYCFTGPILVDQYLNCYGGIISKVIKLYSESIKSPHSVNYISKLEEGNNANHSGMYGKEKTAVTKKSR